MSALVKPFRALRPVPERAADVAAPPYDVLSSAEARRRAAGKPWSFLHISKPEIDLPEDTDPYADVVYTKAAENLERMRREGILVRDAEPHYYVYRLRMGEHEQTGIVLTASVAAYAANRIRRHEFTRPQKEDDRVRQISALNAQTGPVLLTYRSHAELRELLAAEAAQEPLYDIVADDGIVHQLWRIDRADVSLRLSALFDAMDALYIADGHHRSAAAARVAAVRRAMAGSVSGDESWEYFLCVAFPHDEMQILDYNRVVRDLNGLDEQAFLEAIGRRFRLSPASEPVRPARPGEFGMYLPGRWYRLVIDPALVPQADPVASLDVSLLQAQLLAPILGIGDPRQDERIDFVGGIRGLDELERRVDNGDMAVAFSLFPTSMEALMAVADANEVMPPKSTWFEPKLADGLVSHLLD